MGWPIVKFDITIEQNGGHQRTLPGTCVSLGVVENFWVFLHAKNVPFSFHETCTFVPSYCRAVVLICFAQVNGRFCEVVTQNGEPRFYLGNPEFYL